MQRTKHNIYADISGFRNPKLSWLFDASVSEGRYFICRHVFLPRELEIYASQNKDKAIIRMKVRHQARYAFNYEGSTYFPWIIIGSVDIDILKSFFECKLTLHELWSKCDQIKIDCNTDTFTDFRTESHSFDVTFNEIEHLISTRDL